jgi:class 3 adenylate cyclase
MNTKPQESRSDVVSLSENEQIDIRPIKYVFLDVVGFTKGRTTDAQVEILRRLNSDVLQIATQLNLPKDKIIYLPTGDGMCIALVDISQPFDIHLQIAVNLVCLLHEQNLTILDETRRFSVRIGLNECDDTVVQDINNSRNVAGLGVNIASRVMELADASQIMVSASVHERLRAREKYMSRFREFWAEVKHGEPLHCFQYVDEKIVGLSHDVPKTFQEEVKPVVIVKLNSKIAVYLALCVKHKTELIEIMNRLKIADRYFVKVMLWFMAEDYVEARTAPEFKKPHLKTKGEGQPFLDRFKLYEATDHWVAWDLQNMISEKYLLPMWECFEPNSHFLMPSAHGLSKLKSDHPLIAEDFGLMPK